jgi:hypothetical protein
MDPAREFMHMEIVGLTLLLQIVVPVALIVWVALARGRGSVALLVDVMLAASIIVLAAVSGLWLAAPWYTPRVLAVLLAIAAVTAIVRCSSARPGAQRSRVRSWVGPGLRLAVLLPVLVLTAFAIASRRPVAGPAVDLAFPLAGGTWIVANGGSGNLTNAHVLTLEGDRYRNWRGQSHAVNIVKVGGWGTRRAGLAPRDPADYAAFGEPVLSPCTGTVVIARDGLPDMSPPEMDLVNVEGNHVILDCGGTWIVLAHFVCGSVAAREGDTVRTGDFIARLGNSGRSDEPHLHIHAQTPGTRDAPLGGDPLPMRFDGRQLVRNERIGGG